MRSITSRAVSGLTVLMVALVTILGLSSTTNAHASAEPATAHTASGLPKVLKVGTEGVYPPFSYHKGSELTGFDVDYMRALGNKLGIQIQFVEVPWDSMFAALSSGRIDLVANQVTLNPQRQQLYDLSNPYIETTGVVVVNDSNNSIHSLKDIRGKRAAENITSNWAEVAKAAGAQIVTVDGMDKAIQNLRQGSVDVMVNDQLAVKNYIAGSSNPGIKIVAQTSDKSQSVFAARKNTGYMTQINQGIADLRSDGTYQKLYDKYFTGGSTIPSDWELVKQNAWPMAWAAIKVTIPLTIISFALALIIALGVAIARMSANPFASGPARLFISLMRGIPVLVLLSATRETAYAAALSGITYLARRHRVASGRRHARSA